VGWGKEGGAQQPADPTRTRRDNVLHRCATAVGRPLVALTRACGHGDRGVTPSPTTPREAGVCGCACVQGYPMMDFVVRELRAVVRGPMAMLRYGGGGKRGAHAPQRRRPRRVTPLVRAPPPSFLLHSRGCGRLLGAPLPGGCCVCVWGGGGAPQAAPVQALQHVRPAAYLPSAACARNAGWEPAVALGRSCRGTSPLPSTQPPVRCPWRLLQRARARAWVRLPPAAMHRVRWRRHRVVCGRCRPPPSLPAVLHFSCVWGGGGLCAGSHPTAGLLWGAHSGCGQPVLHRQRSAVRPRTGRRVCQEPAGVWVGGGWCCCSPSRASPAAPLPRRRAILRVCRRVRRGWCVFVGARGRGKADKPPPPPPVHTTAGCTSVERASFLPCFPGCRPPWSLSGSRSTRA
jgi:hypothetical protein